jgi:hypothetical protein
MRTIFKTLILSCLLTGCIISQYDGLHDIINENTTLYQKQEYVDFDNVAAIFKEYANNINNKEYETIRELKLDTDTFIERVKNEDISSNYPVKASAGEIRVIEEFLGDVVTYLEKKGVGSKDFQKYINQALKFYVAEIIRYEKKIPQ